MSIKKRGKKHFLAKEINYRYEVKYRKMIFDRKNKISNINKNEWKSFLL